VQKQEQQTAEPQVTGGVISPPDNWRTLEGYGTFSSKLGPNHPEMTDQNPELQHTETVKKGKHSLNQIDMVQKVGVSMLHGDVGKPRP
jgi:hypothetical protein